MTATLSLSDKPTLTTTGGVSDQETVLLHWLLRLCVLFCFIGHGAYGIMTKKEWLPFFSVVGIPEAPAYILMRLIGIMDIAIGIVCCLYPFRVVLVWAAFWCIWTAVLRPLAHMSYFETIERAGNYGIPMVLLLSTSTPVKGWRGWFAPLKAIPLNHQLARRLTLVLLAVTSLLLIGHGGFGAVLAKQQLVRHWQAIGIHAGDTLVRTIGAFEILAGIIVLFFHPKAFLVTILAWKVFTELLYPLSGSLIFETIERSGSFIAPLALVILYGWIHRHARESQPAG